MAWQAYHIVLRLHAPLHVGCGKVGNLQRTRPYVAGRNLWGALTAGLTRRTAETAPAFDDYAEMGSRVHDNLAYTYFYPTTCPDGTVPLWPWDTGFAYRFLSTYAGTALDYRATSAAEASLHEVECLTPHTRDTGAPVYLAGYLFQRADTRLEWQTVLADTQIGGERGYGWGAVELVTASQVQDNHLFDGHATFRDNNEHPIISLPKGSCLLAHTPAADLPAAGDVEPLVGREWRSDDTRRRYAGQYVAFSDICFTPGSAVHQALDFAVLNFGIWQALDNEA